MKIELAGKSVVVTGGSKGIGLAVADAFVAEGARVAIVARHPGTFESVRSSFAGLPFARYSRHEEVADGTLFLASERASYTTGISRAVAGGAEPVI